MVLGVALTPSCAPIVESMLLLGTVQASLWMSLSLSMLVALFGLGFVAGLLMEPRYTVVLQYLLRSINPLIIISVGLQ